MTRRKLVTMMALLAIAFGADEANAQPAAAQAEVLFREGKRLISEGNITAACEAFEGSLRMAPAVSTLMNLADCREKNHQYASAWAHFVEAARMSASDPTLVRLNQTAKERANAVEGRMSYLIINVPDEARVKGLAITRNGVAVDPAEWNRDIPVDGGEYEIEGKAPAYEAWTTRVTIGDAKDKQSVNVPRFREAVTSSPVPVPTPEQGGTGKRKVAIGLWVGGALALGVGVGLEVKSRSTYDDAKAATDNTRRHELTDSANQQRNLGMVVGAVGVVAIGAGVYLWLSGRPAENAVAITPIVDGRSTAFALVGTF